MLRRLSSLLLVLACAFAPVAPALAAMLVQADACCCATQCACAPTMGCAPAPGTTQRNAPNVGAAVEQAAATAKPAPRVSRLVFTTAPVPPAHRAPYLLSGFASRLGGGSAADGVALFQAHCSLRI